MENIGINMNKITIVLIIFIILLSITSAQEVWIESPHSVLINDIFEINIKISGNEIHAVHFELRFNSTVLNAINITEGEFLKNNGDSTYLFKKEINNSAGTVKFIDSITFQWNNSVSGNGTITTITFKALSSGISKLGIQGIEGVSEILMSPDGPVTNVAIQNTSIMVSITDLTFDSLILTPKESTNNQTVHITALIKNSGNVDANNVKIEFLNDDVSIENKTMTNILKYSTNNMIAFSRAFNSGLHNLTIKIDSDNKINEFNENNNVISKLLMVDIGKVCGIVKDSGTNQPISNAIINTLNSTISDSNGNYCLFLPVGNYTLWASDPYEEHNSHLKNINITNGNTTTCDFSLQCSIKTGTLCGIVSNKTSLIKNALINAINKTNNLNVSNATTNNTGEYCITLGIGNYTLFISKENHSSVTEDISILPCVKENYNFYLEPEPICNEVKDIFDAIEMLEYLSGQKNLENLSYTKGCYKFVNYNDDINLFDVFALIDRIVIGG
ncbi:MAG: carboxypeptidase regulatory-like domain-containing protein [Candidatus Altarchaeum sp.]|nr:carboxypeptidase regulatory-like domain-containing protein [Candidatus Altarchaeum sp.]